MFRRNPLKAKIGRGMPTIGCWVFISDSSVVEVLAQAGFDALIIDHEHCGSDLRSLVPAMQAMQTTDCAGLIRIPSNDRVYVKRALDIGVEGIVVPNVQSAEEAAAAVSACRYPPMGVRGLGFPFARAADYGALADYAERVADNLLICPIIESRAGFDHLEAISAVDGIDMLMMGPGDLSADLGKPGALDDAEVVAMIEAGEKIVLASGKWLAGIALDAAGAKAMFARGYHFVAPAADVWFLRDGGRTLVEHALGSAKREKERA
jgi:4-hydroxy-2-oxoheptanedioate aldolase